MFACVVIWYPQYFIFVACIVFQVNAFAVGDESLNIRGIYPTAFLIAHSCVCNTSHTDDEDYNIKVFSSLPIPKDDMISLSYTNSLQVNLVSFTTNHTLNSVKYEWNPCVFQLNHILNRSNHIMQFLKSQAILTWIYSLTVLIISHYAFAIIM